MASLMFSLILVGMLTAAIWTAAWSFRRLGFAALGPLTAGAIAGFCLMIALLVGLPYIQTHAQNPMQPALSAAEAAAVAHAENMLDCRRNDGDAAWCDGFTRAVVYRSCDRTWFITLASADRKQVRRVSVGSHGSYDELSGSDDDPSPGERESFAKYSPGHPGIDEDLRHCHR